MNSASRRLLALMAAFAAAFIAVTVIRTWLAGGDFRSWIPGLARNEGQFKPEAFTLPDKAPLEISDVELLSRLNNEYARLTEAVVPSVVSINTAGIRSEQLPGAWGQTFTRNLQTQGQGSGVIVTAEGHVMTNHHVIANQQTIEITLHDGKHYSARLIGEDPLLDIAVLKIDSNEKFTPLKLGDSSQVQVGQMVFAVGNPFGLGETVTQGIISAKERSLSDNQRDLFQTDAAINPGNSGGPLVNLRGEIIGINVAIFSRDRENPSYEGVGFSIPANDVKESLLQILERGHPIYGYLGIYVLRELDQSTRERLGYQEKDGVVIALVNPGSPAEIAGLQPEDVVRSVNGTAIRTSAQLLSLLQRAKVGTTISMDVWRKGTAVEVKATISEAATQSAGTELPKNAEGDDRVADPRQVLRAIGVGVRDLSMAELSRGFRGAVVVAVAPDRIAAKYLKKGDLVFAVNGNGVMNAQQFLLSLAASVVVRQTHLDVLRDGRRIQISLPQLPIQQ